jgi:hypothetical protein
MGKVLYFTRLKNPKEGLKPVTKDDILPIAINVILGILVAFVIYEIIDYLYLTK